MKKIFPFLAIALVGLILIIVFISEPKENNATSETKVENKTENDDDIALEKNEVIQDEENKDKVSEPQENISNEPAASPEKPASNNTTVDSSKSPNTQPKRTQVVEILEVRQHQNLLNQPIRLHPLRHLQHQNLLRM